MLAGPEVATEYKLDVLVIAHDRIELTIKCLNALYSYTNSPFHLIVVDDSTDLTPLWFAKFQKQHDNITYIHSDEPYTSGNQIFNIGFAHTKTDYVVTLMNSCTVEPDWELQALHLMETHKDVGIIGFKAIFPNGQIESAGIMMNNYLPCDIGRDLAGHRLAGTYECDAAQWAMVLLRREAIPVLDEDVFYGFRGWDDIDNCFAVKKAGWKIFYCGQGVYYHYPRATRGDDSEIATKENAVNGEQFYKRNGFWEAYLKANPVIEGDTI